LFKAVDQVGSGEPHPYARPDTRSESAPLWWAALFVLGITLWRLAALWFSDIELFFDEAQYWYWAQDPAFGYFSKPPLLAWLIAGSTAVFGDGEFGVRAFAPVCYALTAAFGGAAAYRLSDARAAAWAAVMLATLPGVSVSSTVASTDVPLLLCWAAALYCWIRYSVNGGRWWIGLGIALGLGLLAKYAMIYFAPGIAAAAVLVPAQRKVLGRSGFWAALLLGLLVFSPNIWWNYANGFVSFDHTAANADWQGSLFHPNKLGEFVGGQFGVFGPILLVAFCWALARWRRLNAAERMMAAYAIPVLALMLVQSLIARAHANWAAVAYIAASVMVCSWLLRHGVERWLKISLVLHLIAAAVILHGSTLAPALGFDPWHRQRGWTQLAADVQAVLDRHPGAILVAGDREVAASMMYYLHPHPWNMVKWNPDAHIDDHYELTSSNDELRGKQGILLMRSDNVAGLQPYFETITSLGQLERKRPTRPPEQYFVYLVSGYRGQQ
jgi:4-amino-4-deoxy-L-arabinose transferase-like glycosyltransferase